MKQHAHLVHMANQIAANFATMGDVDAAAAAADHIAMYWDRRMKASILADPSGLTGIAAAAIDILALNAHPAHATTATEFTESDGNERSDAG